MVKRIILLSVTVLFLGAMLSACHTTEPPCPAYAYEQENQPDNG